MSDKWEVPDIDDGFRILTDKKTRSVRINTCKECPELSELLFCKQCNCFMPVATWISYKKCKIDKW